MLCEFIQRMPAQNRKTYHQNWTSSGSSPPVKNSVQTGRRSLIFSVPRTYSAKSNFEFSLAAHYALPFSSVFFAVAKHTAGIGL